MSEIYIKVYDGKVGLAFTLLPEKINGEALPKALVIDGLDFPEKDLIHYGGTVAEKLSGVEYGGLDEDTSAVFYFPSSGKYYEMQSPIRGSVLLHMSLDPNPPPAKAFMNIQYPDIVVSEIEDAEKLDSLNKLFGKS